MAKTERAADILEVYTDAHGAQSAAAEWRQYHKVPRVRVVKRIVRAAGRGSYVWVVCVWERL